METIASGILSQSLIKGPPIGVMTLPTRGRFEAHELAHGQLVLEDRAVAP